MDYLLSLVQKHPCALGAILFWLAVPGITASYVQGIRRGWFSGKAGIVRRDESPRTFRFMQVVALLTIGIVLAMAIASTVLALRE